MIKTTKKTEQPKTTFEKAKDFLVNLDRDPEIGYHSKATSKIKKKGGKK